jgi:hypothetical protein
VQIKVKPLFKRNFVFPGAENISFLEDAVKLGKPFLFLSFQGIDCVKERLFLLGPAVGRLKACNQF